MADLGYPNARVRAWKSFLFDKSFFDKLMATDDVKGVISILSQTQYQKDIEEGSLKYKGISGVEEGLRLNLARTLARLLKIVGNDKKTKSLIEIILGRWDIYNLKTVLRGFHAGAKEEEILEQLIPVGVLDKIALRALARQPGMKAAIDQLIIFSPQYAKSLIEGYREYKQSKNLARLELRLDKRYFEYALKKVANRSENTDIIRQVMKREIDFINLMTLFRLTQEVLPEGSEVSDYFLEGGNELKVARLIELAKIRDVQKTVDTLSNTKYYDCLKRGLQKYKLTGSLANIERALEDFNTRKIISLFRANPLSIAIIVAYVWAKINEIINIRIIIRGKEVNMPPKEIKEALVFV